MNTPNDIIDIANVRFQEAELLCNNGFYDGSYYLAGYSIELALKAKICELLDIPNLFNENRPAELKKEDLKPFFTHNIKSLLFLSGRGKKLQQAFIKNNQLAKNWNIIANGWNENCRYLVRGTKQKKETIDLINAIGDAQNGILIWILNT